MTHNPAEPACGLARPLRLRPVHVADEPSVRAAQVALAADDFVFALDLDRTTNWSAYVERLAADQRGDDLPGDRVPASFLLADVGGVVVGRTSIRHRLNEFLRTEGGHIGYGVLPAFRRQGYATEILRQSLIVARAVGVERTLVTCDDDNIASSAVIERCGGFLDPDWPRTTNNIPKRRYWID